MKFIITVTKNSANIIRHNRDSLSMMNR